MIEKLILINWESHVYTVVDFDKNTTILCGDTDAGKSGIFRALRFVLLNTSEGDGNINYNAKETTIELYINGHVIKRIRSTGGKNEYWLDDKVFKAFGQDVPSEIQEVIGMQDINYEWQFDKRPFLISETSGYVAQTINNIVNLSLIETSLKDVETKKRSMKKQVDNSAQRIKELEEKVISMDWVKNAMNILIECKEKDTTYKNINDKIKLLNDIRITYNSLCYNYDSINWIDEKEMIDLTLKEVNYNGDINIIKTLTLLVEDLENLAYKIVGIKLYERDDFTGQIDRAIVYKNNLLYLDKLTDTFDKIQDLNLNLSKIKEVSPRTLQRVIRLSNIYTNSVNTYLSCNALYNDYTHSKQELSNVLVTLNELQEEYKRIAPKTCPLCGSPFKGELD